jgi:hypothetical protein
MATQISVFVWMAVALLGLGLFTLVAFLKVRGRLIPNEVRNIRSKRRLSESAAARSSK